MTRLIYKYLRSKVGRKYYISSLNTIHFVYLVDIYKTVQGEKYIHVFAANKGGSDKPVQMISTYIFHICKEEARP